MHKPIRFPRDDVDIALYIFKKARKLRRFSESQLLTIAVGFRSVAFLHTPVLRLPVMHSRML